MHLMVLGASRREIRTLLNPYNLGLNAPDGAGCFPTNEDPEDLFRKYYGLNAPDGAGCFPTVQLVNSSTPTTMSQCT